MTTKQETIERLKDQIEQEKDEDEAPADQPFPEEQEPVEEAEARSSIREYVVLAGDGKENWVVVTRAEASSTEGAIKSLGTDLQEAGRQVPAGVVELRVVEARVAVGDRRCVPAQTGLLPEQVVQVDSHRGPDLRTGGYQATQVSSLYR